MVIDRRVARTRTALYDALVALIRRKPYELITVEDILRQADVGRSTFYAHFTSKDDLLERSLDRLRALLVAAMERLEDGSHLQSGDWKDPARVLFEHVAEYADVNVTLAGGRGGAILRDAVDRVLADVLRESFPKLIPGKIPRELAILHIVSSFNTTMKWWLDHELAMSPADADMLFRNLVLRGLPEDACRPFIARQTA